MDIKIRNDIPTVRLLKSESAAIETTAQVCRQLGEWLGDESAADMAKTLLILREQYATQQVTEDATSGNGKG